MAYKATPIAHQEFQKWGNHTPENRKTRTRTFQYSGRCSNRSLYKANRIADTTQTDSKPQFRIITWQAAKLQPLKNRKCLNSGAFDSAVILTSPNAEIASLSPTFAPTVFYNPKLLSRVGIDAVPDQQHSVIGQLEWVEFPEDQWQGRAPTRSVATPDPTVVVEERLAYLSRKGQTCSCK